MSTAVKRGRGRGRAAATLVFEGAIIEIVAEIQPCSVRAVAYKLFTRLADRKKEIFSGRMA